MTTRSTDPSTSKDAGKLATTPAKLRSSHMLILNVFRVYGAMNDKALIEAVHGVERSIGVRKLMSPSGVRSRRSELAKPNMDRMAEIEKTVMEEAGFFGQLSGPYDNAVARKQIDEQVRARLRAEGFRSKLWDTGARETVDGRSVIVWGLAK